MKNCAIIYMFFTLLFSAQANSQSWPPPADHPDGNTLLADVELEDENLKACLMDWAGSDINGYTYVKEIRELNCTDAGVQSLKGMEIFQDFIIAMDLSGNEVTDWSPIYGYHHLGALFLYDTEILCSDLRELRNNITRSWISGTGWDTCTEG
jgi:hypothetical protein